MRSRFGCFLFCLLSLAGTVLGGEIHVSKRGKDSNPGTAARPFLTLGRAASVAVPGDRVIVHEGVYREAVRPERGGSSEETRIVYRAAAGGKVVIKGSERVQGWKAVGNGVWVVEVGNDPAGKRDLGGVYLNDQPLKEAADREAVLAAVGTWFAQREGGVTKIWAHFGVDPNKGLVEIPMRAFAFAAEKPGIDFITFEGFSVRQVAAPPAFMDGEEPGAIATGGGTHWIIRHNTITDVTGVAISIGQTGHPYTVSRPNHPAYSDLSTDIGAVGHHRVSGNRINRCGQAGIFGLLHGTASVIDSNRIEGIDIDGKMAGFEPAGIRLALVVDAIIKDNYIEGGRDIIGAGADGIFLGPLYQGVRVSGNTVAGGARSSLRLYDSHGPLLVDNNILKGGVRMVGAEAGVFVKNTFYDAAVVNDTLDRRPWATSNFLPHSLVIKQTIPVLPIDDRWFGNRFGRGRGAGGGGGLGPAALRPGTVIDYNDDRATDCPRIDASFIGLFPLTNESIEEPDGRPIVLVPGGRRATPSVVDMGYVSWPVARVSPVVHSAPFVHPGLLQTRADLLRIKDAVARGIEPWKSGFAVFAADPASSAAYVPRPVVHVERSLLTGMGKNIGNLEKDGNAAYQNALMWCITGEEAHARKAIEILDGWSSTLKIFDGTDVELGAGICGLKFANAAELMRATYPGWSAEEVARCQGMFLHVFYPPLEHFAMWAHGNWDLSCMKSMMAFGVFCDDHSLFDRAVDYFYHGPGNGSLEHYIVNLNGQVQESGRDQGHTQLGIGQLAEICQMAWSQGLDLYGADDSRLLRGFEYVARFNMGEEVPFEPYTDRSGRFPAQKISLAGRDGKLRAIYEMVFNHYQQAGLPAERMKYTRMAAEKGRPEGPGFGADHPGFGTLLFTLTPAHPAAGQ